MNGESTSMVWPTLGSRTAKNMSSSVATGAFAPPQRQSGRVMGIAEIRGEKIGGGVGVPDHFGQTNYAEICILVTKYI